MRLTIHSQVPVGGRTIRSPAQPTMAARVWWVESREFDEAAAHGRSTAIVTLEPVVPLSGL
jgi:hypothetical protein